MASRKKNNTDITEADLAAEKMGKNSLQGDDQSNVHNQRHAVPGVRHKTDGIIESLEKQDKHVRAKRDLGKGDRTGKTESTKKESGTAAPSD